MQIHYSRDQELPTEAHSQIDFDVQSLLQIVAAERDVEPELWLADPSGYQADGHVLRDSSVIRLIAYSIERQTIYATDGCNSCRHKLDTPVGNCQMETLKALSEHTQVPIALLEKLIELLR